MSNFKAGDICRYSFVGKNKSDCTVKIVRILDNPRGVAEAKFLAVRTTLATGTFRTCSGLGTP